ncbi:MAG: hypothetical protein ACOYIN_04910 [Christensenellales bacterium]|jgi:hypothetical protein
MSKKDKKKMAPEAAEQPVMAGAPGEGFYGAGFGPEPDPSAGFYDEELLKEELQEAAEPEEEADVASEPASFKFKGATFKKLQPNGPVAVIAPVNPVQLTPIVVPVAIVPYATQNQPLLQYAVPSDQVYQGQGTSSSTEFGGSYDQPQASPFAPAPGAPFAATPAMPSEAAAVKKPQKASRVLFFLSFLFSAIYLLPILLGYFEVKIATIDFAGTNFINELITAIQDNTFVDFIKDTGNIGNLLFIVAVIFDLVVLIMSLVGLFSGKTNKVFIPGVLLALFAIAGFACNLILRVGFDANLLTDGIAHIILAASAILATVFTFIVFVTSRDKEAA